MHDIHVVGAGPAGCIAAMHAAKKGLNVLISEEHPEVGLPAQCSGVISKKGLDSLGIDYSRSVQNKLKGAVIRTPNCTLKLKAKGDKAIVIDRALFDQACAESAVSEGVNLQTGIRVKKDGLKQKTIIGADGPSSSVAQWFDFPRIGHFVSTIQCECRQPLEETDSVQAFLSNKEFPGFFGWAIPINEETARIGMGAMPGSPLRELFEDFMDRHFPCAKRGDISGGAIPLSSRPLTAVDNSKKILLTGDAAGQTKATTGGGVYYGGSCARLAGELSQSPLEYEKEWRRIYGPELYAHRKMREFYNRIKDSELDTYLSIAKALGAATFLEKYGDMDKISSIYPILEKFPLPSSLKSSILSHLTSSRIGR